VYLTVIYLMPSVAEICLLPEQDLANRYVASPLFDISGRVALITGASRGIGRAIAQGLAEAGASVALSSRTQSDLLRTAEEIQASGARAEVFPADVARVTDIQVLVQDVVAQMGQIDILVNVAGVNRRGPSTEITEEDWDTVLSLNLKGLFFTSQAVGRYWIDTRRFAPAHNRGKGKIINIGSIAGEKGSPRSVAYTASKSGVLGVTRTLAVEWAADGICVNCLAPGYIETELTKSLFDDPIFATSLHNRVPMGRRGYPIDLVGAAVFLAAPASDYLTGQAIVVDGGFRIA
jgi:NAD(P)-dependent dehydrogenase (short-subunit alcohol dehydrogenase family)